MKFNQITLPAALCLVSHWQTNAHIPHALHVHPNRGAANTAVGDRVTLASPASREVAFANERADNMFISFSIDDVKLCAPRIQSYAESNSFPVCLPFRLCTTSKRLATTVRQCTYKYPGAVLVLGVCPVYLDHIRT